MKLFEEFQTSGMSIILCRALKWKNKFAGNEPISKKNPARQTLGGIFLFLGGKNCY
jgi:hypothetical protein